MPKIQDEALTNALNDIATFLTEGTHWHLIAANQCLKIALKGYWYWHSEESETDKSALDSLMEVLRTNLEFTPKIDMQIIEKTKNVRISNLDNFLDHHLDWIDREEAFVNALNFAMKKSESIDVKLYQELSNITEDVQGEIALVKYVYGSFKLAGFQGHDIAIKSKYIGEYFRREYKKGKPIDFLIS